MKSTLGRILTGHRPTGPRHIGHLMGTLETWARLQDTYECFFLVADLHVLTTDYEHPARVRENTTGIVLDWLAAGIDPTRSTLVLQSAVAGHTQLNVLLGMLATVARLSRVPTYKEQVKELHLQPSLGFLGYPVLQAADILIYKADTVPVGEDQLPHIELTRELARRFNQLYGQTFPEPEGLLSPTPRLPGIDNRTMHTSYGNAIFLADSEEETTRKVMSMYTDPTRLRATDPGHVEGNPTFAYHEAFNRDRAEVDDLKARYVLGKVGDVEVKQRLAAVMNDYLRPIRTRRAELAKHPGDVLDALREGTRRANQIAEQTLAEAQERMGLASGLLRGGDPLGQIPSTGKPAEITEENVPHLLYVP